jgi:hypothetical protein
MCTFIALTINVIMVESYTRVVEANVSKVPLLHQL